MKSKRLKLLLAGIGASAVIAMGVLGVALSTGPDTTGTLSEAPDMTLGETTTSEGPTEVETPQAAPDLIVELPDGYGNG